MRNQESPHQQVLAKTGQPHAPPFVPVNQLGSPPAILASSGGGGQVPKPKKPGSKRLPNRQRSKDSIDSMIIYALLVGINAYEQPVGDLHGCINDIDAVASYLREVYGDGNPVMEALSPSNSTVSEGGFFEPIKDFFPSGEKEAPFPSIEKNGKLRLLILTDEQATRENIIRGFEEHLTRASSRDTVWFHFSGHGAEQFTASEFFEPRKKRDASGQILPDVANDPPLNPSGKDQCLVCFTPKDTDENRTENHKKRYLADKELAKLIKKIEEKGQGPEGENPHIVLSVDACNSGSISRDPTLGFKSKLHNPDPTLSRDEAILTPGKVRRLEEYIGNYTPDNLHIPLSSHIAFSASQSNQLSWDSSRGGIFTTSLIHVLREAHKRGKALNYNEVFLRTRAHAIQLQEKRGIKNPQNPQFQPFGGFNPYIAFLEGWKMGTPGRYKLLHKNEKWYIRCGAVHGIPNSPTDNGVTPKVQVKIFPVDGNQDEFILAFIDKVGAQHSLLDFLLEEDAEGNPFDINQLLSPDQDWEGEVLSLPGIPIYIHIEGPSSLVEGFMASPERPKLEAKNIFLTTNPGAEGEEAPLARVTLTEDLVIIVHNLRVNKEMGRFDHRNLSQFSSTRDSLLTEGFEKIATAERFIELENPTSKIGEMFETRLILGHRQAGSGIRVLSLDDIEEGRGTYRRIGVHANEDHKILNDGIVNHVLSCNLQVHMDRIPQTLHFYSFFITPGAQIGFYSEEEENVFFERGQEERTFTKNLREGEDIGQLSLGPNQTEDTFWFKVIATTEELDFQLLTQDGLFDRKDFSIGFPNKISHDWATATFEIHFSKTEQPGSETA